MRLERRETSTAPGGILDKAMSSVIASGRGSSGGSARWWVRPRGRLGGREAVRASCAHVGNTLQRGRCEQWRKRYYSPPMRTQGPQGLPRWVGRSLRHHFRRIGTSSLPPRPASHTDTLVCLRGASGEERGPREELGVWGASALSPHTASAPWPRWWPD